MKKLLILSLLLITSTLYTHSNANGGNYTYQEIKSFELVSDREVQYYIRNEKTKLAKELCISSAQNIAAIICLNELSNDLFQEIQKIVDGNTDSKFKKAHDSWLSYVGNQCEAVAYPDLEEGVLHYGTVAPYRYNSCSVDLYQEYLNVLIGEFGSY